MARMVREKEERSRFNGIGLSVTDATAQLKEQFGYDDEKLAAINGRPDGFTRLMNALEESREDEARLCVAYGCDVNMRATGDDQTTALHYAAAKGLTASVRLLIAAGAAVDAECSAGHPAGRTPLSWASFFGRLPAASALLKAGARPNAPSRYGTPLHLALLGDHGDVADLLRAKGGVDDGPEEEEGGDDR